MNQKNAFMDGIRKYQTRQMWIEEGEVDKVYWREDEHSAGHDNGKVAGGVNPDMNVVDVILRDRRIDGRGFSDESHIGGSGDVVKLYIKRRVPVMQHMIGHWHGHPWVPRVGDLVKVLFYQNQDAVVIGATLNWEQYSVCRPDPYTFRWKFCQWERPYQKENKDFGNLAEEGEVKHPAGKKPFCFNIFHGKATDKPVPGRDFQIMWDYCHLGDKFPSCEECRNIDYTKRIDGDHWLKVYSKQTESKEAPPGRFEYKNGCGTYIRIEENCGPSTQYSEGRGMFRIENAVKECDKRSHFNMNPLGTVDIHSVQNKGSCTGAEVSPDCTNLSACAGCCVGSSSETDPVTGNCCPTGNSTCSKACETKGHRIRVISDLDTPPESCEMIDLDVDSYIKIMKTGDIHMHSLTEASYIDILGTDETVEIHGTDKVLVTADTDITNLAPTIYETCTTHIISPGACEHGECSCPESDERLKTNVINIEHGLDDVAKLTPVKFNFIRDIEKDHLGFIAQDVQKVIPEVVQTRTDEMLGIRYDELIPVLVKAIQELNEKIRALEQKV